MLSPLSLALALILPELIAPPGTDGIVSGAVAVARIDAEPGAPLAVGFGPGYEATFDVDSVRFRAAGDSGALALRLDSVSVGDRVLWNAGPPRSFDVEGRQVVYAAGSPVEERYTLRSDGLKQDVVVRDLGGATGELVVRMTYESELRVANETAAGLLLADATGPAISIGSVVGIDAAGARATGELRRTGDVLEAALPADFVATAELPITVDPLLSSHHVFPSPASGMTRGIDVAWSEEHDCFFIVWDRLTGSGSSLICFTAMSAAGFPLMATKVLATFPTWAEVTAGPAMTDIGPGAELVAGWAISTTSNDTITAYWLRPDLSTGTVQTVAKFFNAHPAAAFTLDVGMGDIPGTPIGGFAMAFGDGNGDVYALTAMLSPAASTGPDSVVLIEKRWLDQDPTRFDGFPSVPRSGHGLVVWQRGSGYDADIVGRWFGPYEAQESPVFEILADPEVAESRPMAAGDELDVAVVAETRDSMEARHVAVALRFDAGLVPEPWTVLLDLGLAGFPLDWAVGPPAIGLTRDDRYVYAACYDFVEGRRIIGFGMERPWLDSCGGGVFVIEEDFFVEPRISENANSPDNLGVIVWAGSAPSFPTQEARGARVKPCD